MGVPSFYRWLVNKYPKITINAIEEKGTLIDNSSQNKNGEFHNFYIDMNAIIHPCFHPDDQLFDPTTFDEVFENIYEYIDRLFSIVRPRKLLYLAVDGVAPRAKMNQQRARRFRASKDHQIAEEMEEALRKQFEKEGKTLLRKEESQVSDSNVITPGTEFMHTLSKKLENYIKQRINENETWRNIMVILSDANVPGEGEHKIMSFIRSQRLLPDYDPNTRHCLYGLDADLIMLALATHELYFSIIREDLVVQKEEQASGVTALENAVRRAEAEALSLGKSQGRKKSKLLSKPYQFLHVWILREYLELDMDITDPPEKFVDDFERIVDDFVFICFFVGNDFLPHVPSLEIHEGAIDLLMHVYKKEFKKLGGFLVDMQRVNEKHAGYIKLKRVEKFIFYVGQYEDKIFEKRSRVREKKLRQILSKSMDDKIEEGEDNGKDDPLSVVTSDALLEDQQCMDDSQILCNTRKLKQKLKDQIRGLSDTFKNGGLADKVKLGVPGWKERYYKEKFSAESSGDIENTRKELVKSYGEGLCWVLLYYFHGVPSWTWFYPYHYAPFASDFKGLSQINVNFQKGLPFQPFDQLMGVLPPRSAHALPLAYKELMLDSNSKIIDFYPTEFETDIDGKRYLWQAVCKLPFIDGERLLTETRRVHKDLKDFEILRNTKNPDKLFVGSLTKFGREIRSCCRRFSMEDNGTIKIDGISSEQISSFMHPKSEGANLAEVDDQDYDQCFPSILFILYETPHQSEIVPRLLPNVKIPDCKTVFESDIPETTLWHEHWGNSSSHRPRFVDSKSPYECSTKQQQQRVHKYAAGRGFSFGRGKNSAIGSDSQWRGDFPGHAIRKPFDRDVNLSNTDSRGRFSSSRGRSNQPFHADYSRRDNNFVSQGRYGEIKGIEGLQISQAPPIRNNFLPSNTISSTNVGSGWSNHPSSSHVWQNSLQISEAPPIRNNFRPSNTMSTSNVGSGWSNHPSSSQVWQNSFQISEAPPIRNFFRPSNTLSTTNVGPRWSNHPSSSQGWQNSNQTWQQNPSVPANLAGRGRGVWRSITTENNSQTWQQNPSVPANFVGRGWGVRQSISTENNSQTRWQNPSMPANFSSRGPGVWQSNSTENNSRSWRKNQSFSNNSTGRGRSERL